MPNQKTVHNVHPSLQTMLEPLDSLVPLEGNPRVGNVEAITASLVEFGQMFPLAVHRRDDGRSVVVSGNHRLEAMRRLGWTHAAVVDVTGDDSRALAFALLDNRIADMARNDTELLTEAIGQVIDDYTDLFETLGWDDFEFASMERQAEQISDVSDAASAAFVPPVLLTQTKPPVAVTDTNDPQSAPRFVAPDGIDQRAAVIGGATVTGQAGKKATYQYQLVFDDPTQMQRWWEFIKHLRADPGVAGDTLAERLLDFLDAHADF